MSAAAWSIGACGGQRCSAPGSAAGVCAPSDLAGAADQRSRQYCCSISLPCCAAQPEKQPARSSSNTFCPVHRLSSFSAHQMLLCHPASVYDKSDNFDQTSACAFSRSSSPSVSSWFRPAAWPRAYQARVGPRTAMLEPRPARVALYELLLWRFGDRGVRPARGIFASNRQIAGGAAECHIPAACQEEAGRRNHQRFGPGLHPPAAARRWYFALSQCSHCQPVRSHQLPPPPLSKVQPERAARPAMQESRSKMTRSQISSILPRLRRRATPVCMASSRRRTRRYGTRHWAAKSSATTRTRVRSSINVPLKKSTLRTVSSHCCC